MEKTELYSKKLSKGSRTYFFDIKQSEKNDLYFTITESNKRERNYEKQRVMVFEEHVPEFVDAFWDCLTTLQKLKKEKIDNVKNEDVNYYSQIRETYPKAYTPWTKDEDNKLIFLLSEGFKINELSKIFQRNEGAIESRVRKLGL